MPILRRLIYKHEKGMGDEDWYYLARNTETGRVYIVHEWSHHAGKLKFESGDAEMEIVEYLQGGGTRQDRLLQMIGTLVEKEEPAG
ncbi:hypothetical protein [Mesorhizobium sp. M0959]|uniref:hypothetical protein n=1 Tax=unclassified Mesorhizobium TaxID=325217 RepID=UPI0033357B48